MTKAKTISLFWNNTLHTIVPNDDGMYNLNGLHMVSGYARSKAPSEWTRHNQATELVEKYSKPGNPGLKITRGGAYLALDVKEAYMEVIPASKIYPADKQFIIQTGEDTDW